MSDTLNALRDLDRAEVEPFALKIVSTIDPYCSRVEVAGSIQRRKPTVNDIEIVVQPKPEYSLCTKEDGASKSKGPLIYPLGQLPK